MSNENDRIIIVGAGPVGLTAALALAPPRHSDDPARRRAGAGHGAARLDVPSADARPARRVRHRAAHDRGRAEGADLAVPRPRNRAGRDLRSVLACRRHQPSLSRAMRAVEADAVSRRGAAQASRRRHPLRPRGHGGPPGREVGDRDGADAVGPGRDHGPLCDRRRRRAQRGAPLARRRVRGLHLSRAVSDRLDRFPVREHADRHRLCELHRRSAGMAGAAAGAGALARAGAGAGEFRPRASCFRTKTCRTCCNAWCRGPSRTRSRTARSITCISGWRRASATAACCWPATPPTSTIRSAAWA